MRKLSSICGESQARARTKARKHSERNNTTICLSPCTTRSAANTFTPALSPTRSIAISLPRYISRFTTANHHLYEAWQLKLSVTIQLSFKLAVTIALGLNASIGDFDAAFVQVSIDISTTRSGTAWLRGTGTAQNFRGTPIRLAAQLPPSRGRWWGIYAFVHLFPTR
jgi:hypothetical protein